MRTALGLCAAAAFFLAAGSVALADADGDWGSIEQMEKATPARQWNTREEFRQGTIDYLNKQEKELRAFASDYPKDPRAVEARLRLAHLLATRADLEQKPAERAEAGEILDAMEKDPAFKDRRADIAFARISIYMQRADAASMGNRDTLLEKARGFASDFPGDHRVAALLAEVASVFQDSPRTARSLLEQARPLAGTPELKQSIDDDLKRLSLLGKPLEMQWTSVQGQRVDLARLRGKVVLIYFFASWSAPSMYELDWVNHLADGDSNVQMLGVCLDNDPVSVPDFLEIHNITWPVFCDGRGWQGELVRSLGINELPVLWIVDRKGILRALDAKQEALGLIQEAEKGSGE
ncbi:MAG TPA: TlpA disulfide reductase family protein [Chthoniobacteraceae bacterium]|nr:TlpA disulfide reductase family protein [Chthoniobacteraceae bacterium]